MCSPSPEGLCRFNPINPMPINYQVVINHRWLHWPEATPEQRIWYSTPCGTIADAQDRAEQLSRTAGNCHEYGIACSLSLTHA